MPLRDWSALADLVGGEPSLLALVGYLRATYGCDIKNRALLSEPGPRIYYE